MEHLPSTLAAARYSRMAITIYCGILFATLLEQVVGNAPRSLFASMIPTMWQTIAFSSILLLLSSWEWGQARLPKRYHRLPPSQQAILHLTLQLCLTLIGVALSSLPYALFLFYPLILFCSTRFNLKTRLYLVIPLIMLAIVRVGLDPNYTFFTPTGINHFVTFGLGLLLAWGLGSTLAQETAVRHQMLKLQKNITNANRQLQLYAEQAAKLVNVDERIRLASDIHHGLGHHLTAVSTQLDQALAFHPISTNAILEAQEAARHALCEVRQSARLLQEENGPFSLETAVSSLIQRLGDLLVRFSLSGDEHAYSQLIRLTMLRAVQEGLVNIYKHADATQASLNITFVREQANIVLHDNGRGLETGCLRAIATTPNGRWGLQTVRERLNTVGGELEIESVCGKGTTLWVCIPQPNLELSPVPS